MSRRVSLAEGDYAAFLTLIAAAGERLPVRVLVQNEGAPLRTRWMLGTIAVLIGALGRIRCMKCRAGAVSCGAARHALVERHV